MSQATLYTQKKRAEKVFAEKEQIEKCLNSQNYNAYEAWDDLS